MKAHREWVSVECKKQTGWWSIFLCLVLFVRSSTQNWITSRFSWAFWTKDRQWVACVSVSSSIRPVASAVLVIANHPKRTRRSIICIQSSSLLQRNPFAFDEDRSIFPFVLMKAGSGEREKSRREINYRQTMIFKVVMQAYTDLFCRSSRGRHIGWELGSRENLIIRSSVCVTENVQDIRRRIDRGHAGGETCRDSVCHKDKSHYYTSG